jgi:hypothetical protein
VTGRRGWTDGPDVARCLECGTRFAGMVCPTCRQFVEPHEAREIVMTDGPKEPIVLAERTPDPAFEALFDDRGVA